ncbi:hypothetical protein [Chloroflexus sp.]|uniref:hypothetical protein n=1 Tax=Chloroflexus sp. TaxID=1904827 RepID=UPI002ACE1E60|nr:hypothetical protein [Chloroflexus sp.]
MNQSHKPARNDVTGLKWAFSATALAVTIGGWGGLAAQNPPEPAATVAVVEQSAPTTLQLPTVPTLVPLNVPSSGSVTASAPAQSQPAVREVMIPAPVTRPAPMARTRSSR